VQLAEADSSGVAAQCTVAANPTAVQGSIVFRWPVAMHIYRGPNAWSYVQVASAPFNNADGCTWTEPAPLAPGDYLYYITPFSDSGEEGQAVDLDSLTIAAPPAPPTNLHYVSGNAAATVIGWTPSTTAGATYNVYTAPDGQPFNLNTPDQSLPARTTAATLGAYTSVPGVRTVLVRCVSADRTPETNINVLRIEYDASGNVVPARPNQPQIVAAQIGITSGRTVSVPGNYPSANEAGIATQLQLFSRQPLAACNFDTPDATADLAAGLRPGVKTATLTATYGSDGPLYICLRAVTADGTPGAPSDEVLIDASAAQVAAPGNVAARVSRG
jgi:hypothetical protein